ncbi:MAG: DUF711 family protein [Candidatus Acidiferrales bacterium]
MNRTPSHQSSRQVGATFATLVISLFALLSTLVSPAYLGAAEKPKVRAVTAFVRLEPASYQEQVQEALTFLRRAKVAFERAGYDVQSIRIATQPFPEYTRGMSRDAALAFLREYDALAKRAGFDASIGPAMLEDANDPGQAELLRELFIGEGVLNASLVVAGEDGVRWKAVREAAELVHYWAKNDPSGLANFGFAATALVPPYTPFFPAAYHRGPGREFALALQSANVVAEAFTGAEDIAQARRRLSESLGAHAVAIERAALSVEKETGWGYRGIDLSPAPLKEVSIGGAVEKLTGAPFGASGTMTAAALITEVLRSLPVQRTGYSGMMVPVLEDSVLAERWSEGTLTLDALLAYSAVCGTGLDTIPLPGEVTVEQLERIIGDMASLAVKLRKPLSARLMPVAGKKAGERTEFNDPYLTNAVIQPLH